MLSSKHGAMIFGAVVLTHDAMICGAVPNRTAPSDTHGAKGHGAVLCTHGAMIFDVVESKCGNLSSEGPNVKNFSKKG